MNAQQRTRSGKLERIIRAIREKEGRDVEGDRNYRVLISVAEEMIIEAYKAGVDDTRTLNESEIDHPYNEKPQASQGLTEIENLASVVLELTGKIKEIKRICGH